MVNAIFCPEARAAALEAASVNRMLGSDLNCSVQVSEPSLSKPQALGSMHEEAVFHQTPSWIELV